MSNHPQTSRENYESGHIAPVIVFGSCIVDITAFVPRFPSDGESLVSSKLLTQIGGKASNQAIALSRLQNRPILLARIGKDHWGNMAKELWENESVDAQFVVSDSNHHTGMGLAIVREDGQNFTISHLGANAHLAEEDFEPVLPILSPDKAMLLHLNAPTSTVHYVLQQARNVGMTTVVNLSPSQSLPSETLALISVAVVNEVEATEIAGIEVRDIHSALAGASEIFPRVADAVIVTLGSKGSVVRLSDGAFFMPPFSVSVKDTTAAGDAFCAALTLGIALKSHLLSALRFASAAAAVSVTRVGTWQSLPTLNEVNGFLKERSGEGQPQTFL